MVNAKEILKDLTLDEKIGQLLCKEMDALIKEDGNYDAVEEFAKTTKTGSIFIGGSHTKERIKKIKDIFQKYSKLPILVSADVEFGPGSVFGAESGEVYLPCPMAWGACDDPDLIEKAHIATAERCREYGIHWSFAPVVDINMNMQSPEANIRAVSDKAEQVAKITAAAVRGMQSAGLMVAGCKHFPGEGVDGRNSHMTVSYNDLPFDEWMDTFGYVYKEMFKEGTASVMVGHIALPSYDEPMNDWIGCPPCTFSRKLMTELLKGELGFDGCIVSDAMTMAGAGVVVPRDRVAVEFIKAGGDIVLFPKIDYFDHIKNAVLSGEIPMERIDDAVLRVIKLKERARLFEDEEEVLKGIEHKYDLAELAKQIEEKSITLVRNFGKIVPFDLKPGAKVAVINLQKEGEVPSISNSLETMENELKVRGFEVKSFTNPGRPDVADYLPEADAIFVNVKISSRDCVGGTLRLHYIHTALMWSGFLTQFDNVVFASFGDPYKLYDYPYVKNYINVYSPTPGSQRAYVRAVLGEIPFEGKSPVGLKGLIERQV